MGLAAASAVCAGPYAAPVNAAEKRPSRFRQISLRIVTILRSSVTFLKRATTPPLAAPCHENYPSSCALIFLHRTLCRPDPGGVRLNVTVRRVPPCDLRVDRGWWGPVQTAVFAPAQETGATASVEVLAGPERRRRWSSEQKQAIVAAEFARRTALLGCWSRRPARALPHRRRCRRSRSTLPAVSAPGSRLRRRRLWRPRWLRHWRGGDPGSLGGAGMAGGRAHRHAAQHEQPGDPSARAFGSRSARRRSVCVPRQARSPGQDSLARRAWHVALCQAARTRSVYLAVGG